MKGRRRRRMCRGVKDHTHKPKKKEDNEFTLGSSF